MHIAPWLGLLELPPSLLATIPSCLSPWPLPAGGVLAPHFLNIPPLTSLAPMVVPSSQVRQLEALVRLSEAMARVYCEPIIRVAHVEEVCERAGRR